MDRHQFKSALHASTHRDVLVAEELRLPLQELLLRQSVPHDQVHGGGVDLKLVESLQVAARLRCVDDGRCIPNRWVSTAGLIRLASLEQRPPSLTGWAVGHVDGEHGVLLQERRACGTPGRFNQRATPVPEPLRRYAGRDDKTVWLLEQ